MWWRQAATQSDGVFITPAVRPAVAGALCVPVQTNTQHPDHRVGARGGDPAVLVHAGERVRSEPDVVAA